MLYLNFKYFIGKAFPNSDIWQAFDALLFLLELKGPVGKAAWACFTFLINTL
jgi:hypothetical protein